ncbi:MAG TPA: AMP-binding protein, partial [Chitinophagaceae bacterium]
MNTPKQLWTPSPSFRQQSNLTKYSRWLQEKFGLSFPDYAALWQWSVDRPADFWETIWQYFEVIFHSPYTRVMSGDPMPRTRWFEGSTLNYAEHVFRNHTASRPAIIYASEQHGEKSISWEQLENSTAALQAFLLHSGVKKGDTVAAYLPNIPEATIGLLATLSIGAVWSSCSPDFGTGSVVDRFQQISPKVLIAVDGYRYNGKPFDRMETVKAIREALPSVHRVILVSCLQEKADASGIPDAVPWEEVQAVPH